MFNDNLIVSISGQIYIYFKYQANIREEISS